MGKLTLKEKNEYIMKQMDKYEIGELPEKNAKKCRKYGDELEKNRRKEEDDLYDLLENNKINDSQYDEYITQLRRNKIFSLDEIPELKKVDSKSEKENKKPLTKTQQNNLIRKIPDNKFTEAEIHKIIEHIRNGSMTSVSQMPNPTKKQPKVPLSDVVVDKKKK